jgi:hypothetical protein
MLRAARSSRLLAFAGPSLFAQGGGSARQISRARTLDHGALTFAQRV